MAGEVRKRGSFDRREDRRTLREESSETVRFSAEEGFLRKKRIKNEKKKLFKQSQKITVKTIKNHIFAKMPLRVFPINL